MDGPASRRKFVFGIVFFGASRWPLQIVIRSPARMFSKNTHFRLSVLASATLLWFVWMKSGASAPRMDAVSREMGALAVQQGAIAAWHAERTYNLVFALMIYLIAITLIWSHAFFGGRTPPAGEPAAAVDGPASR